jgi:hypothetical protein
VPRGVTGGRQPEATEAITRVGGIGSHINDVSEAMSFNCQQKLV